MGKAEKKMRKEARNMAKTYISDFESGKEMFSKFVEQLDRKGKRMLIKAIRKGNVRELLGVEK